MCRDFPLLVNILALTPSPCKIARGRVSWHFSLILLYFIPSSSLSVLLLIDCKTGKGSSANLFCDVKIQRLKMGQTNVFSG
jgi:hypothetical protein